jgi:hypothetical protein
MRMKNTLPAILFFATLVILVVMSYEANKTLPVFSLPDSTVYKLTRTTGPNAGELDVYCLNGADATIRPVDTFGHIVVSCGK